MWQPLHLRRAVKPIVRPVGEQALNSVVSCAGGAPNALVPAMGTSSAAYEPFAWWLARKQIGQALREHYAGAQELPPRLLTLVRKLEAVEGTQCSQTLVGKLDAIEGSQLLRACRKRLHG